MPLGDRGQAAGRDDRKLTVSEVESPRLQPPHPNFLNKIRNVDLLAFKLCECNQLTVKKIGRWLSTPSALLNSSHHLCKNDIIIDKTPVAYTK
jgi:hypothetical protein